MEGSHHGVSCVPQQYRNYAQYQVGGSYNLHVITVLLVGVLIVGPCEAAFVPLIEVSSSTATATNPSPNYLLGARNQWESTLLRAKNTNKPKKRKSRSHRRDETPGENHSKQRQPVAKRTSSSPVKLPRPPLKQHTVSLAHPHSLLLPPLQVVALQVEDPNWWQQANEAVEASGGNDSSNPFGARLWPSALGIAEFLVHYHYDNPVTGNQTTSSRMTDRPVLELGCGGGLCSIVAASLGARVVASDISSTVLELTELGWAATRRKNVKRKQKSGNDKSVTGSLEVRIVDLASKNPLPIVTNTGSAVFDHTNRPLVMAAAMLYSTELALLLARRAFEATHQHNAWVVIGDDDSGEREGGRSRFFQELDRLEHQDGRSVSRTITKSVVQNQSLKWSEKRIQLIHLNHPDDIESG